KVARLNIATLATLAGSPGIPQNVRVTTSNLDNDTILKWDAPKSYAQPVTYQIVWRETTVNDWQYVVNATQFPGKDANSTRLPVSKDNVFFGVRACTAAGICSQAVGPVPSRE
ncbi:MAG TPA: M28 family metallopeptidase, partial [Bryobacteraceae bacterium]